MARIPVYALANSASSAHLFYTGFTWVEIEEIFKALKESAAKGRKNLDNNWEYFDDPDYAGLPKKIFKRFTSEQVDMINVEMPNSIAKVAWCLARGK